MERRTHILKRGVAAILCCFIMLSCSGINVLGAGTENQTVRVAVTGCPNFLEQNGNDTVFGYAKEYLDEIAKYTGWNYEYVNMTISEAQMALSKGEVDLLPGMTYTSERASQYEFSEIAMGISTTILCVSEENEQYSYNDFVNYNGIQVGTVKETTCKDQFLEKLQMYGVTAEVTEYDTDEELESAYQKKEVDAILYTSMERSSTYKKIASFDAAPIYFGIKPDAGKLKEELDVAMQSIMDADPYYSAKLDEAFYGQIKQQVSFTPDEQSYIDNHPVITVALSENIAPVEYYDQEQKTFAGFTVGYYSLLSERTGLQFKFVPREDAGTLKKQAENGEIQMVGTIVANGVAPQLGAKEQDIIQNVDCGFCVCEVKDWMQHEPYEALTEQMPRQFLLLL